MTWSLDQESMIRAMLVKRKDCFFCAIETNQCANTKQYIDIGEALIEALCERRCE